MLSCDGGGFISGKWLKQREFIVVLTEVGSETYFIHLLISESMVADQDSDLARRSHDLVECPCGSSSNLPIVRDR